MTEEELYNLAEEFANKIAPISDPYNVLQNVAHTTAIQAYIAGYNSRNKAWVDTKDEDNHPKIDEQIIIAFGDNARMIIKYQGKETFETWKAHHWMPMPQLPKTND